MTFDDFKASIKMKRIEWFILLLFSFATCIGVVHHEIWLDEAQHFLLSRDSRDLEELWKNTRYEGHPILWNLILYVITRFSWNPFWMQLTHWIISVLAVSVFLFYSPLKRNWKILFCFGYFILFEYTMISRNYSLLLLFFFLSLKYYPLRVKYKWHFGGCIFVLANTHLFGLIIAFWLVLMAIIETPKNDLAWWRFIFKNFYLILFLTGAALCVFQTFPPSDSPFIPIFSTIFSLKSPKIILRLFLCAFWPIPNFTEYHFWNSNLLVDVSKLLAGVASIYTLAVVSFVLGQKQKVLFLFCGIALSIACVVIILYPNSIVQANRHFGIIYIVFIGCLWICQFKDEEQQSRNFKTKIRESIILLFLIIQIFAGMIAFTLDYRNPFSESRNVASFLNENNFSNRPVLTFTAPIPTISAYIEKRIYSTPSGELSSFFWWNEKERYLRFNQDSAIKDLEKLAKQIAKDGILITYRPVPESEQIRFLNFFNKGIVRQENFYVYELLYK
jgi:hypothetical protein